MERSFWECLLIRAKTRKLFLLITLINSHAENLCDQMKGVAGDTKVTLSFKL
jgi:hypothetical protein